MPRFERAADDTDAKVASREHSTAQEATHQAWLAATTGFATHCRIAEMPTGETQMIRTGCLQGMYTAKGCCSWSWRSQLQTAMNRQLHALTQTERSSMRACHEKLPYKRGLSIQPFHNRAGHGSQLTGIKTASEGFSSSRDMLCTAMLRS